MAVNKELVEKAIAAQTKVYELADRVRGWDNADDDTRIGIPLGHLRALMLFLLTLERILDDAKQERRRLERGG